MKLRRKLLAAGFAFGATALTLTTSTFAWYTSNTSVETTAVSGVTSTTADASSFYVAAAQTYDSSHGYAVSTVGNYTNKATPIFTGTGTSLTTGKVLTPVSYVDASGDGNKFVPIGSVSSNKTTVNYGEYAVSNVYEWVYRFRTAEAGTSLPLYFKNFTFGTSKTDGATNIFALAYGDGTGITSAGTYFADLAKAMKLTITQTPMSDKDTLVSASTSSATYALDDWATASDTNIGTADAVGYYNQVLGTSISAPTTYDSAIAAKKTGGDAISFATIPASGYVEVRFTLWLDGWDTYCYDICRMQQFQLSFNVTSDSGDGVDFRTGA